jgi:hypothetical protein
MRDRLMPMHWRPWLLNRLSFNLIENHHAGRCGI